jgi:uncharacterized protein YciI
MRGVDDAAAQATLLAAHQFLAEDARIKAARRGCIGWCFGGAWSLRLALAAPDLDAAVLYYGRPITDPERLRAMRAPLLGVFGTRDRSIPTAEVDQFEQALKAAGRRARILRYDAEHAFANPSNARYDQQAAAAAWEEARAFLAQHLRPRSAAPDPASMRTFLLGVLKAGSKRQEPLDRDAAAKLQEGHLAHIAAMAGRGEIAFAGPMTERPGEDPIIGLLLFTVPRERAEALVAEDPLVKAGRLRCELLGWYGPKWLAERNR